MSDTETNPTFGAWLKARRRSLDMTQEALADRAACSVEMVRKVEAGSARPSRQLAEMLATSVGVTADEIPQIVQWARLGEREAPVTLTTRERPNTADNAPSRAARVSVLAAGIALGAAGILVLTGAVLFNGRPSGSPEGSLDVPSGISATSPVALSTAAVAPTDAVSSTGVRDAPTADPLDPRRPNPLPPGKYRLTVFRPQLEFNIPEAHWMLAAESTDAFELGRYGSSDSPDAYIGGEQVQVVFDLPCVDAPTRTLEERPRALIEWLQDHDHLSTSNLRPVSFAGFTGLSLDISYDTPPGDECAPFESDADVTRLHLWKVGQGSYFLDPGERARVISVDVEGRPLTILAGTYNSDHYDDYQDITRPVLESILVNR